MLRSLHIGACALLAIALGCTESFKPDVSTETGNPPVTIDSDKIALVVTRDEVHIRGEAGAVMPPEGEVEITTVSNREVTSGPVDDDGSFDVQVDGSIYDVFEVRAVNGMNSSMPVVVIRGGAEVGEGEGGELTCMQKTSIASSTVTAAIEGADKSCTTDDDCMLASPDSGCFLGCGYTYLSAEGLASVQTVVDALDDGLCEDFDQPACNVFAPPCVPPEDAQCVMGECTTENASNPSCMSCLTSDLTWRVTGAGILPALPSTSPFTLSGCDTLELVGTDGATCTAPVPQCNGPMDTVTMEAVIELLQDESVAQQFEMGGTLGYPEDMAGYTYELTLGESTVIYRSCAGGSVGVLCEPSAFEELVDLLELMGSQHNCGPTPEPEADCTSAFDAGECDAAFGVWWHDPQTGACVRETYGGCGGNDNRYASLEDCQAACPPPSAEMACPPNRVLVEDVCLECRPVGGCSVTTNACMLVCSDDAQCADEASPMGAATLTCRDGVCEEAAGCF